MFNKMWADDIKKDSYIAFRTTIKVEIDCDIDIKWICASCGQLFFDGKYISEGPCRFHYAFPQYETITLHLNKGEHALGAIINYIGEETRIIKDYPPFFTCVVEKDGAEIELNWKYLELNGYKNAVRRINVQLGFMEYCDMNNIPQNIFDISYYYNNWHDVAVRDWDFGKLQPLDIDRVKTLYHIPSVIAKGTFAERYGYEFDDISTKIILRDLDSKDYEDQGIYIRLDLGKVMLSRMKVEIEAPKNTEVDIIYSELLYDGRVTPFITLSSSTSCNMDHYVLREGRQTLFPVSPRGGRFVEIHIRCKERDIKYLKYTAVEKTYYDYSQADFKCNDLVFNDQWKIGVETLRSCCEDAVIDNPTRERGEWTGDVIDVALQIGAVSYSDVRLMRRALIHSAQCANDEGLIAGLVPGGCAYYCSYASQWVNACYRYYVTTRDLKFLQEMWPYAIRNAQYFVKHLSEEGISRNTVWSFVDWGYKTNEGPTDMAVNLHCLSSMRYMIMWSKVIGREKEAYFCEQALDVLTKCVENFIVEKEFDFEKIGLHCSVLALKEGFFTERQEKECIKYIKIHYEKSFPNCPSAPKLWSPTEQSPQIITPYFSHYVFPILIEHGEMDFVMQQFHSCWGYLMGGGRTTWCETFDPRWTHCHQWSGCPTWILSRYCLGLFNRFDIADNTYDFKLDVGCLKNAQGRLPITNSNDWIDIKWKRKDDKIYYELVPTAAININYNSKVNVVKAGEKFRIVVKA